MGVNLLLAKHWDFPPRPMQLQCSLWSHDSCLFLAVCAVASVDNHTWWGLHHMEISSFPLCTIAGCQQWILLIRFSSDILLNNTLVDTTLQNVCQPHRLFKINDPSVNIGRILSWYHLACWCLMSGIYMINTTRLCAPTGWSISGCGRLTVTIQVLFWRIPLYRLLWNLYNSLSLSSVGL